MSVSMRRHATASATVPSEGAHCISVPNTNTHVRVSSRVRFRSRRAAPDPESALAPCRRSEIESPPSPQVDRNIEFNNVDNTEHTEVQEDGGPASGLSAEGAHSESAPMDQEHSTSGPQEEDNDNQMQEPVFFGPHPRSTVPNAIRGQRRGGAQPNTMRCTIAVKSAQRTTIGTAVYEYHLNHTWTILVEYLKQAVMSIRNEGGGPAVPASWIDHPFTVALEPSSRAAEVRFLPMDANNFKEMFSEAWARTNRNRNVMEVNPHYTWRMLLHVNVPGFV